MSISAEKKQEVITDNARAKGDTGSPERSTDGTDGGQHRHRGERGGARGDEHQQYATERAAEGGSRTAEAERR